MITVWGMAVSGNCWKVAQILRLTGHAFRWIETDANAGDTRTRVMEWLFFEQYSHEPYIAVARNIVAFRREKHLYAERLAECWEKGGRALAVMERRLAGHDWLTDAGPTVADLALFAYTHVAGDGEFDLSAYPGIRAWIARLRALPGIVPLD